MVATAGGQFGTIGGGQLEYRALEQARAVLSLPVGTWRVQDYPLGPLLAQCCGGRVRLLIEHLDPGGLDWLQDAEPGHMLVTTLGQSRIERAVFRQETATHQSARGERPDIGARIVEPVGQRLRPFYLFGAGHVGQAIVRHMIGLPLQLAWFDTRPEMAAIDGDIALCGRSTGRCCPRYPHTRSSIGLQSDACGYEALAFVFRGPDRVVDQNRPIPVKASG
jgi:xanthine dehydrogenase accessory factor